MTQNNDNVQPQPTPPAPNPTPAPPAELTAPAPASAPVPTSAPEGMSAWAHELTPAQKMFGISFLIFQALLWVVFAKFFVKDRFTIENMWQMLVLLTLSLLMVVAILLPAIKLARREPLANVLSASAALYLWIPIWAYFSEAPFSDLWPVLLWAILNTAGLLGAGLWLRLGDPALLSKEFEINSLVVMLVCGWIGFSTALLGLLIPFGVQDYPEVLTSGMQSLGDHWPKIAIMVLAQYGGLGLMLAGLQFGKSLERSSAGVRRLLYGSNAVLACLVLFEILASINMMTFVKNPYVDMSGQVDWSKSQLHTLSPATENLITSIDKPAKVYILLDSRDPLREDCDRLIQTCRSFNNKITYEVYSPYTKTGEVESLMKKYQLADAEGLLIVYGPDTAEVSQFVSRRDLFQIKREAPAEDDAKKSGEQKYLFKGEAAIYTALKFLADDKKRAAVYFVQINGAPSIAPSFGGTPQEDGYAELRGQLQRQNYDVKPLELGKGGTVPEDAEIVVVGGLKAALPGEAVNALQTYMNPTDPGKKKGKMIVMLDPLAENDKFIMTGLEGMLEQFNVLCPRERLLSPSAAAPLRLTIWSAIWRLKENQAGFHPIAQAFVRGNNRTTFTFEDVRPIEPQRPDRGPGARFEPLPLVMTSPSEPVWQSNKGTDPFALRQEIQKLPREDPRKENVAPAIVGVAVHESPFAMPGHPPVGDSKEVPRLIVFGSSRWVNDAAMREATGKSNADLFASSCSWLRGKSDLGVTVNEVKPTEVKEYTLANTDSNTINRLRLLPAALILLGLAGLGGGIWAVRRR